MSQSHGTHSYFDWQVSTLMLAYDAVEPLSRADDAALETREKAVQRELYELVHALLPDEYLKNPQADFPPEIVTILTKGTIARAAQIMGMTEEGESDVDE